MKAQESIFDMFAWRSGEFHFVEEETLEGPMVPMHLHVAAVVMQGMERLDDLRRVQDRIPSGRCIPVSVGPLADSQLPAGEQQILELVNDDRTVEEISIETHSSEFHTSKVLFNAVERGVLKIVTPRLEVREEAVPEALTAVEAETLIDIAGACINRGELARALRHLRAARSLDPNGESTERAVAAAEESMRNTMKNEGVSLKSVPQVAVTPEEIQALPLSPEEGFVLSRIDGTYDIESILKISPMPRLEAQLVFRKLLRAGHIHLNQGAA